MRLSGLAFPFLRGRRRWRRYWAGIRWGRRGRRGATALAVRRVAGRKAEVRGGRWPGGDHAVGEDEQAAIEQLAHVEAAARPGAAAGARRQLHHTGAERDRVVASDEARVAAAQEAVQITRGGAPNARQARRGGGEAAIVV